MEETTDEEKDEISKPQRDDQTSFRYLLPYLVLYSEIPLEWLMHTKIVQCLKLSFRRFYKELFSDLFCVQ